MEFKKIYEPKEIEKKWYNFWEEKEYYKANPFSLKPKFSIVIPPPNITGPLHIGHALNNTIQDILCRYKRLAGYEVLWLPGIDHASIATHSQIEKELRKEGKSRFDIGKEEFLKRAWLWKEKYHHLIVSQLKSLGCLCDWSRFRFTMDDDYSYVVRYAFVYYYKKGWIYRDLRIINWCPNCHTAISDLEVKHKEIDGFLWYIKYPLKNDPRYLVVATTRPETMLGDTAVMVNPTDERYKDFIGKKVILPLQEREIPVIADEMVDTNFGTGVVKVTPAHDPNDFIIGKKYNLEFVKVIDEDGKIIPPAKEKYVGLDRFTARKKILEDLKALGLLAKVENYQVPVGVCARCETIIEPLISKQWFLKMKELAKPAIEVVEKGEVKFVPLRWKKVYLDWLSNVKDWCLSRQLWWGHPLPVYYCLDCDEIMVTMEKPKTCQKCNSQNIKADEDVLDTWFSSALWPFATMGFPKNTKELEVFYPTDVLVTDPDIIFLWVARMVFSSLEFVGKIPFKYVYIHSTVLNEKGERMSRTKGIGIDPQEIIDEYGADALRFTLTYLETQSQSFRLSRERFIIGRNFANKVWNAGRLLFSYYQEKSEFNNLTEKKIYDYWICELFNQLLSKYDFFMKNYYFSLIAQTLYTFFWNNYCDWYLEFNKERFKNKELVALETSLEVFYNFLKILHPIMPFITEELWHLFNKEDVSLMEKGLPELFIIPSDKKKEIYLCEELIALIKNIRNIRANFGIPKNIGLKGYLKTANEQLYLFLKEEKEILKKMVNTEILPLDKEELKNFATIILKTGDLYLVVDKFFDLSKEKKRLEKEIAELEKIWKETLENLNNEEFLMKARKEIIEEELKKKEEIENRLKRLKELI
uniref:Valine--tRNA ligase n=1 Tax=candidate division WOR-3 bacterium TaxID=2052148 RepID=A0A7V3ZVR6_UNCW3